MKRTDDARHSLLDDYLAIARRKAPAALVATTLRTRSPDGRLLLARAATGDGGGWAELLSAARAGDVRWLTDRRDQVDSGALANLAKVVALQDLSPTDRADGLAIYDLLLAGLGPKAVPPAHRGTHAQLAYCLGDLGRAAHLLATYPNLSERVRRYLELDLANPFVNPRRTDLQSWFRSFAEMFPECGLRLEPAEGVAPFDRLRAQVPAAAGASMISVVVTAYRPDESLLTAVRSIAQQSWRNLEILVVDDGSPPDHDGVLSRCLAVDPRVRLIKLPDNSGTYAARNAGLDAAAGEFVTFQDSDDWSHPCRLEWQAGPLLEDPALVATLSWGIWATDQLAVTRLGRPEARTINSSSLMVRREVVLTNVGYLDSVRKAADTEYIRRLRAVFGDVAVRELGDAPHALIRLRTGSLSRADFAAGWKHPARCAYVSAYSSWHDDIRGGNANPYLPKALTNRPFAAPPQISGARPTGRYDVVFAGDWAQYGGPQKSMLEEIRALSRRGAAIAVMDLEAFRLMTAAQTRVLCRPIQELINEGLVGHVDVSDEVETSVLIIRYPPVLQFAAETPSGVRAGKVIILANQAPAERDGSDRRYLPLDCSEKVRRIFGAEPLWCPQGPNVRDMLAPSLPAPQLAPFDIPGIIDFGAWAVRRRRYRSTRPVLGRHSRDNWTKWPADREAMLQAYPPTDEYDVRLMGGVVVAKELLGGRIPHNWLALSYDEIDVRTFLYQLDFFVYYPNPRMVEAFGRAILEALAVGCVAVLPPTFRPTFGEAAVYAEPNAVQDVVSHFYSNWRAYSAQSEVAQQSVRERFSHDSYADLVCAWIK